MDTQNNSLYAALSGCCLSLRLTEKKEMQLEASADFLFPADFAGFQGHFPGNPILPAVVQLAAVRFLAERALGQAVAPVLYRKIKFKGQIRPDDPLIATIALKYDEGKWGGRFSLARPDGEALAAGLVEMRILQETM